MKRKQRCRNIRRDLRLWMRPLCTQFWYTVGQIYKRKKEDYELKIVPKISCKEVLSPKVGYPGIYFQKVTVKQYKEPLFSQNQGNHIFCANTISILVPTISLLSKKYYTSNSPAVTI